jgi:hypothetical protein
MALIPKIRHLLSSTLDEEFSETAGSSESRHIHDCRFSSRVNGRAQTVSRHSMLLMRMSLAPTARESATTSMPL